MYPNKPIDRSFKLLSQSVKAAIAFRLRAFFCIISIALGIAAITIIVGATEGAYKEAFEMVGKFGPDAILVIGGSRESQAIGDREKTITLDDVQAIKESFINAYLVIPFSSLGSETVSYKNKKYKTQVIGSDSNYSSAWSWPVIQGDDINDADIKGMKNVGLIGQDLARELFGEKNPVGSHIFVKGIPVKVVGLLQKRGSTARGHNLDNRIVMPISTVMKKIQNEKKYVSMIRVRFENQKDMDYHIDTLIQFLRKRHNLNKGEPDDFFIVSPKEIIKFLVALTGSLILFIGISGIISLLVAGFVIANLFLLSVKERSMEIGIRRSVGASQLDIMLQFQAESLILTTAGGLLGFLIGISSSKLLMLVAEFPIYFSWKAFAGGIVLSWLIGIVFGLQPSLKAARMNPVEAIRT